MNSLWVLAVLKIVPQIMIIIALQRGILSENCELNYGELMDCVKLQYDELINMEIQQNFGVIWSC